ncbi:DNA-binding transcriptional regulator, MerR family [Actinacidiphila yanglinensis]|uniref:DNA-binding transcriptional regulator, MerR family n=1 Tax=Actinacidiphila yanglinensis TaxID=310779 RepID=A0A1H6DVL3_9ACTN|nr:MerR family transcriptional regulator [Actinacidiphila yanglinensis]SEG89310.1 DNA-binding transcriptional regulator, MerR family [Actinacidiphila yanglinensis]
MTSGAQHSIGDLARRTGLTVKAVRYYSERGLLPVAGRTPAGHRRYDGTALARLRLLRTLRELGVDLATARRVLDRELSLPEVARAHADALAVQIRLLRVRHAVLTVAAERAATPEEMELVHRLATLSAAERDALIADFLDAVFDGPDTDPAFTGVRRSLTPELPDPADPVRVQAWVELAELTQDPGFRASVRQTATVWAAGRERAREGAGAVPGRDLFVAVQRYAAPELAAGTAPTAAEAAPAVAALVAACAGAVEAGSGAAPGAVTGTGTGSPRDALLGRLRAANDPRRDRYLHLLAVVNEWPPQPPLSPVLDWAERAVTAHVPAA